MTALTRRPYDDDREGWHIYFADVRIGSIGKLAGVPNQAPQWGWSLGFYPGMEPGWHAGGDAETFEQARAAFEARWNALRPRLTEDQFEAWRRQRDCTAWKYRMWDEGCKMPTQSTDGRSRCFCGAGISIADATDHVQTAHRGIGA